MAYNAAYPFAYPYYQQPMMQPVQMMPQPPAQSQTIQSGFVRVRDENEARMYPVAPGQSVTFVNKNSPYCYTKTVNMGQLDRPIFEKYRLVKEDEPSVSAEAPNKPVDVSAADLSQYATKQDIEALMRDIESSKQDIESFRGDLYGIAGKKKAAPRKEVTADE